MAPHPSNVADDGDFTQVSFKHLDTGGEAYQNIANKMEAELEDLITKVNNLLGDWSGPSNVAWKQAQRDWHASATKMRNIVGQLSIAIQHANSNYKGAENYGVKLFTDD